MSNDESVTNASKVAIFAIHGVSPIQRYAFQDQFAAGFLSALNAAQPGAWTSTAYWPAVNPMTPANGLRATAMRIYRASERDPQQPTQRVYDVYEGYWSPLTKGRTNGASLGAWLLSCFFSAASATANLPATWQKVVWDFGYVGGVLALAGLLFGSALVAAFFAGQHFAKAFNFDVPTVSKLLSNPLGALASFPVSGWIMVALFTLAALAIVELTLLARSSRARVRARDQLKVYARAGGHLELMITNAKTWHRVASAIATAVAIAMALIAVLVARLVVSTDRLADAIIGGAVLVIAAIALRLARLLVDFAITEVLGDIQVYTTRDTTAANFAIREAVVATVAEALVAVLRSESRPGVPAYERVHIIGHSLGSTIAMDVLIRLRQMVEEKAITSIQWSSIRSFVTFGTALEKTRFFFDVRHPTPTAAYDQFQNDVYGSLFTSVPAALAGPDNRRGIFWRNVWYQRDIVANRICSYESDVPEGGSPWRRQPKPRPLCLNTELESIWPIYAFIHGNYVGDRRFWRTVLPELTS